MADEQREDSPQITLTQVSTQRSAEIGSWNIGWEIANHGEDSLVFDSARLPHGQFRSDEHRFEPSVILHSGQKSQFTVPVKCNEPAGLVTENAFVVFQVKWLSKAWRIFVRLRVHVSEDGRPLSGVESVTTQKVGFSGVDF